MIFVPIVNTQYPLFHKLMDEYYREGEDAQTPQAEIDGFVQYLYDLCLQEKISGCVAWDGEPVGFVLWNIDTPEGVFSKMPGYGTVLEIGVCGGYREKGIGRRLVSHALSEMPVSDFYVCAYGPAEEFWKKCGFRDSGTVAENGLKVFLRHIASV